MYSKIKEILKDVRILVVEDDDSLRQSIELSIKGYVSEILTCKNAIEALDKFVKFQPNLILTDIKMPKISGLEMANEIRKSDKNIPIIFLTAYDSDENVFKALQLNGEAVLKKPFDKRELIMRLSFAANKFKSDFARIDLKNGFSFDGVSKELFKDEKLVVLTKKEQALLHLLLKNSQTMVSFDMIQNYVWCGESCTTEAIRAFVYKLRKKLYPELIQNCQGSGYRLNLASREGDRTINSVKYI